AARPEEGTVQWCAVGLQGPTRENHLSSIGGAVSIEVVVANQIGGLRGIEAAPVPESAHRHRDPLGKHLALIKDAIFIQVFQYADSKRRLLQRVLVGGVPARRLAHEQAAMVVTVTQNILRT